MDPQRIVVVEDESIVALDIRLQLEHLGYQVPGVFASGEELIDALPVLNADLILLDIILKGKLDGVETAALVKQRFNLPVILLTALDTQEMLERAKTAQPFAFIVKPFDERELRNAVVISLYRHTMEQAIQRRERLFSTTLESIQDGVLVTDETYRVEYANPIAETILGLTADEMGTRPLSEVLPLRDADGRHDDVFTTPEGQLYVDRVDGVTFAIDRYLTPLLGVDGERVGWVIVIHDVTQRLEQERALREHEEQLRRSQKMEAIGRLTGGIAHDFNNLLTVILGYAKLLTEELVSEEPAETPRMLSDVEGIQKAALRSAALTRQLLAFSRHQIMEQRIVDVNQVVTDLEKMLQRLVSDDVQFNVELDAKLATVRVDPSQLEQVLMNLAVNARDAMPHGGRLTIQTAEREVSARDLAGREKVMPGRFVATLVRDTGVGMTAEVAEHMFEPFYTTKDVGEGTGLGLSTVYGIVTQSGGFIDVITEPGRGTTFTVCLPYFEGPDEDHAAVAADPARHAGTETILLVEDDDAIRTLLERVLREKGYTVLAAGSGGQAIEMHDACPQTIDLLITDVVMPNLSGDRLAERLRDAHEALRVLFISAYPEMYLTNEQRRELGTHFMQKPIDPPRFLERVRAILDE